MSKSDAARSSAGFFAFALAVLALLAFGLVQFVPFTGEIADYSLMSFGLGVVRGLVTVGVAWLVLRAFDHVGAVLPGPMASPFSKMREKPEALAIYFGLRFVGVCYLFASAL